MLNNLPEKIIYYFCGPLALHLPAGSQGSNNYIE